MASTHARLGLIAALSIGLAIPLAASARPLPSGIDQVSPLAQTAPILLARHGADDRPGDDRGGKHRGGKGRGGHDDGPNHAEQLGSMPMLLLAKHGADDRPGDDRGGKGRGGKGRGGKDDGPKHT